MTTSGSTAEPGEPAGAHATTAAETTAAREGTADDGATSSGEGAVPDDQFAGATAGRARDARYFGYATLFPQGDPAPGATTSVGGDWFSAGRDSFRAEGITINQYGSGSTLRGPATARVPVTELELVRRRHVVTGSDPALRERVQVALQPDGAPRRDDGGLILLQGARDDGRLHSALVALSGTAPDRHGKDGNESPPSPVTLLGSATTPEHLAHAVRYEPGHGYVLDATGASWVRTAEPAVVASIIERIAAGACLVIVTDDRCPSPAWGDTVIEHEPPGCGDVLTAHLRDLLREGGSRADPDLVLHRAGRYPAVTTARAAARHPWDAAAIARAVATWELDGTESAGAGPAVNAHRQRQVRRRARDLLQLTDPSEAPRAQAFLLSGAVLDGEALSDVVAAAHLLSDRLTLRQRPDREPRRRVFRDPLHRWLHHVDIVDADRRPQIRLREPTVAGALLDLVWNEYDEAREPLLAWLRDLCRSREETVRVRAALAVGRLASLDFDHLRNRVLDMWGASADVRDQRAAAWALEGVVLEGTARTQALELVGTWSRSGAPRKIAVAVRAYGTRIGRHHFDQAAAGLRAAARYPALRTPVALALEEIYAAGARREVLTLLDQWSRSADRVRRIAAECFRNIADLPVQRTSGSTDPLADLGGQVAVALPDAIRADPSLHHLVTGLWVTALQLRVEQHRAWQILRRWRYTSELDPGGDPSRREATAVYREVVEKLEHDALLAHRLHFYEAVWRSTSAPTAPSADGAA
jgi:hypothetical protein